ncbi:integrase domain-containing protein, partial [Eubacteriales bacterium OttesenSCG-928-N14]|nr:integrase domain-containing protein [Eubacteriales bacterium OttesenSCG-928-N14]
VVMPYRLSKDEIELKRVQQMERADYVKILQESKNRKSFAPIAFEIAARIGARVEGTVRLKAKDVYLSKDGRWNLGQVKLLEKGGRSRYVDIRTQDDRNFFEKLIAEKESDAQLVSISKGAIDKQLTRIMKVLGIKEKYAHTAMHSLRKLYAQETWDLCRQSGMSYDQALMYLNEQLGHGKHRDVKLLAVYVKNMR